MKFHKKEFMTEPVSQSQIDFLKKSLLVHMGLTIETV